MRAGLFDEDRRVTQIHFGGGTPNFFNHQRLAQILDEVAEYFYLADSTQLELSIEIDPRTITPEGVFELAEMEFNRFSIGVRDFSPDVQLAVNRIQSEHDTMGVIAAACKVSDSVNVDLITGLPMQTTKSFAKTLEKVINTGITRVAAYNFAYLPKKIKAQRLIDPKKLPNVKQRMALAEITRDVLFNSGFTHIGMDHYATKDDSLSLALEDNSLQRNFQGYTTHAQTDLIGIGASAISQFNNAFAQNASELSGYNALIKDNNLPIHRGVGLSDDDILRAELIQQIMCRDHVDLNHKLIHFIEVNNELRLIDIFANELNYLHPFVTDELIILNDRGFSITEKGRFFRRQVAAIFDAYLTENKSRRDSNNNNVIQFSQAL